ncbi:MAG: RdgB/HAM1 family non-canonical purine NTP pyrophosphatase [Candidatus Omnitrophica bacterium]|jgi:XTP/dITP diphosphohydrolase|nr:RdgB/HAM1 family non-canonical purine NTP pyrophosphatase [Candidatus Omnitrophota bacterium]
MSIRRLIVATKNSSKFREIKNILNNSGVTLLSLHDLRSKIKIVENGDTFYKNAFKKAQTVSKYFPKDFILGEDSGLEVDYLNGAPGIYSKRFSGINPSDKKNNAKLLSCLQKIPSGKRTAYFRCCLVMVKNRKVIKSFEGKIKGVISKLVKGENGFGYDPVFYLPSYRKTMAELDPMIKNRISHRAKAFKKLRLYLKEINKV